MRSPESLQRLIVHILILAAALCIVIPTQAHAVSAAADVQSLSDSLTRKAAGFYSTEPSVQDILDQLGWNLSAANDEISLSSLCATPGPVTVRILAEHTGLANEARLLWYPAGARTDTTEVLNGVASVNDSTVFQLSTLTQLAWLYTPRAGTRWYSEIQHNYDQRDHLKLYQAPQPGIYILFWEDLAWLADGDFNDLVLLIRTPARPVTVSAAAAPADSIFTPGMTVCVDVDVTVDACNPQLATVEMTEGTGTFAPQSSDTSFAAHHCFQPSSEGLYTFVFEAQTPSGDISQDTVDVVLAAQKSESEQEVQITIARTNTISICHPDTVCVPFSISSVCELSDIRTSPDAHVNLIDSALCIYATEAVEFCVPLVAEDECGNKDSVQVCFIIETSEPTIIDCPSTFDTVLCLPGFACFPVSTTGGVPPVTVSAIPPAAYSDGQTCLYVEESGTYDVYTVVDNAECPPETCHTKLTVQMNRPPQISGLPDTVITVCRDGQFCFGPIVPGDPDGNLSAFVLWDGPGTLSGDTWCYIPPREELIEVVFRAQDNCNRAVLDTLRIRFVNPSAPTITFGASTFDLCVPGEVCVPFSIDHTNQLPLTLTLSGPGTLNVEDSLVCVGITESGSTGLTLTAEDPCGGGTSKLLTVDAMINAPPAVSCSGPGVDFYCVGDLICFRYTVSDPGDSPVTVSISGFGSVQQRQAVLDTEEEICFTASSAGDYTVEIVATDDCGAADTCVINGTIALNRPPIVNVRDTTIFLCGPEDVCIPVSCSDPDGNLETCLVEGSAGGFYDVDEFCFTPDTVGVYAITATAIDSCGEQSVRSATVAISYNSAPLVNVSGSLTRNAEPGDTICFDFTTSDPDANIEDVTVLDNYLSYDNGQVCIEAVALSVVCARIVVTDACGASDTVLVCVEAGPGPNPQPKPELPDTVITRICLPGEVCVPFTVDESFCPPQTLSGLSGATIDYGTPSVCLTVEEPGIYETGVVAADTCGAETGYVVIIVEATDPPQIECPPATDLAICLDTTVCVTATVIDPDGDVASATASYGTTSRHPDGSVELCLPVDTSGTYTSVITVVDSCGLSDTCTVIVRIDGNQPPTLDIPEPGTVTICDGDEICIPVTCNDPDDNLTGCAPVDLGDASWTGESLCFAPAVAGSYQWVFRAVDECGAETFDTLGLTVVFNTAPVVQSEPDAIVPVCGPDTVCHPFTVSDAEGNIASVTTSEGIIRDGQVCVYLETFLCFTITATDSCGLTHSRNVCLTANPSAAPELETPDTLHRRLCAPEDICFDLALGPDSSEWTIDVTPLGEVDVSAGVICFTPDTAGAYTLITTATNVCNNSAADTTVVIVRYNNAPVVSGPDLLSVVMCADGSVCFDALSFADPDGNIRDVGIDSGNGTINATTGEICFEADSAGTYCFTVRVEDSCGLASVKHLCAEVLDNVPPTVDIEELEQNAYYSAPTQICFEIMADDDNDGQTFALHKISGAGSFSGRSGATAILATHCFTADTSGCYRFIFETTDACGAKARDTMTVCVQIEPPDSLFRICIDTITSLNDREAVIKVRSYDVMNMGGFDFLICFDPTALTIRSAFADTALQDWEYFTYRVGDAASCPPCIGGQMRLTGIADMNNGHPHPPESAYYPRGPMAGIRFYVTQDRQFIGQCIPIDFCSYDCADNTISDRSGDTLFVAYGTPDSCVVGKTRPVLRRIEFCEGRLCIVPPEDDRGDMNLNGIANEIADAVFYSRFFIYGDVVFDPVYRDNQILASDVNCDGLTLTVADLIYMIRIITGDASGVDCPDIGTGGKIVPAAYAGRLILERRDDRMEVWLESDRDVGGVFVHLQASGRTRTQVDWGEETSQLKRDAHQAGRQLRVLLQARQSGARLAAGTRKLFSIPVDGSVNWQITESQAATTEAETIQLEMVGGQSSVPSSFALLPNYPNPFNASTQIRFALGAPADWTVTIYNVLGQTVDVIEGSSEAGDVSIQWDAKTLGGEPLASGVYFARLEAGQFSATRQMVLLK